VSGACDAERYLAVCYELDVRNNIMFVACARATNIVLFLTSNSLCITYAVHAACCPPY